MKVISVTKKVSNQLFMVGLLVTVEASPRQGSTKAPAPVEVRDLTHLYCTDKDCLNERKCSCLLAGLGCIDACSCTDCENMCKPKGSDDEFE